MSQEVDPLVKCCFKFNRQGESNTLHSSRLKFKEVSDLYALPGVIVKVPIIFPKSERKILHDLLLFAFTNLDRMLAPKWECATYSSDLFTQRGFLVPL